MAIQAQMFSGPEALDHFSGKVHKDRSVDNAEQLKTIVDGLISLRKPLGELKQMSQEEFVNSPLGQALSHDPVWKALTNKNPQASEPAPTKDELENFFLLIFKFMKSDHSMNTQLQLSSMTNMAVQCNMLDRLSQQASTAMADMDKQISDALSSTPSVWISIVLPVALMIVGALLGAATAGVGGGATEAVEATVEETAEKTILQRAGAALSKFATKFPVLTKAAGFLATGAGMGAPAILQASGTGVDKSGVLASAASSEGQAAMSVISASMEGTQGQVKQETGNQQNDSSNEQADLSMLQQMIQAQQQAFGLGKL